MQSQVILSTKPHGRANSWAYYSAKDNSLTETPDKAQAVILMCNETGETFSTRFPRQEYEFVVHDRRNKREYDSDRVFVFQGTKTTHKNLFHFQPMQPDEQLAEPMTYASIKQLATDNGLRLIGNENQVVHDMQVLLTFYEKSAAASDPKGRFYKLDEIIEITRIFNQQHVGSSADKRFNQNLIILAAIASGIEYVPEQKVYEAKPCKPYKAIFLPRVLPTTVLDRTKEKFFKDQKWTAKNTVPATKKKRKSIAVKSIADEDKEAEKLARIQNSVDVSFIGFLWRGIKQEYDTMQHFAREARAEQELHNFPEEDIINREIAAYNRVINANTESGKDISFLVSKLEELEAQL